MYKGLARYYNRDEMFKTISQEQVFLQHLGIYPETGNKRFKSPFREDRDPGCRFEWKNGTLFFIDNASFNGRVFWDIFHVVMYLYKCNFYEACKIIDTGTVKSLTSNAKYTTKFTPEIRFTKKPWTENNLFNINPEDLERENVYLVEDYYIKTKSGWLKNSLHNPKQTTCIAYYFPDTNHVKLYFPDKHENRWYSNCTTVDIFGLHKVDYYSSYSDLLIITKSQKDRLMFDYKLNMPAIALQNEGCHIPDDIIENLKLKFSKIIIIYDNDFTGYSQAQKLSEKYDVEYRIVENDCKDLYEMLNKFSQENINTLLWSTV